MFGPDQPVILQLIELPMEKAMKGLEGVAMELEDCAFPLLSDMVLTSDPNVGFKDANWCLLVGGKPRGPGMERADLLKDNGQKSSSSRGRSSTRWPRDDALRGGGGQSGEYQLHGSRRRWAKCRLPPERFTAMVRLDENRAKTQLAKKSGQPLTAVSDVYIFGNHSPTMFPAFHLSKINGKPVPHGHQPP